MGIRHIELDGSGHGQPNAAVMIAKLKGAASADTPDDGEVRAFCSRIEGYTFASYAHLFANPDETPLPKGFRNVRVHDGRDGSCLGSIWWVGSTDVPVRRTGGFRTVTERPRARHILGMCLFMPYEEIISWRGTSAERREPGVLDLIVDIETRPRELLMVDGSPLPGQVAAFIASRAPAKARCRPAGG